MTQTTGLPFRTCTYAEALVLAREAAPFVIPGLLASSVSVWFGQPKAGKSALVTALVASIARGERTFLGRTLSRSFDRVVIVTTDAGGVSEYAARLEAAGVVGEAHVTIWFADPTMLDAVGWAQLSDFIGPNSSTLVVIDNLTQILAGSMNDDVAIGVVWTGVRRLTNAGCPVLVVHHQSDKSGQYGPPRGPMGHTAISALARWKVNIRPNQECSQITLRTEGNDAKGEVIVLDWGTPVTTFDVRSTEPVGGRRQRRSKETLDVRAEAAKYILTEAQGITTNNEVADLLAARFDTKKSITWGKELSKNGPLGQLVRQASPGAWEAVG
jgi:hypothetical protein